LAFPGINKAFGKVRIKLDNIHVLVSVFPRYWALGEQGFSRAAMPSRFTGCILGEMKFCRAV
jgi:hypothetical protein